MKINILHINNNSKPDEIQSFLRENISSINVVRISTQDLLNELKAIGVIDKDDGINSLITIRKISNRIMNNESVKKRSPISSPEFIASLSEEMIRVDLTDSYLPLLYVHNVPVFISDPGNCSYLFGGSLESNSPLLSSGTDWHLYRKALSHPYSLYLFGEDHNVDLVEMASTGVEYPEWTTVKTGDLIDCNREAGLSFDYDVLISEQ